MMADDLGFRIVGPCTGERRLVCWPTAFVAYASLDERADVYREGYLSAFTFGEDFRRHLDANGSTKGFDGVCGGEFIWFDIDRADLEAARRDAARLCLCLAERYSLDDDVLLVFFSGSKGFHVGLPTDLWQPTASGVFNLTARRLAEGLAASCEVVIDSGVFDKVRAFRAPNSRHPKTGLHKRALSLEELMRLSVERIQELDAMSRRRTGKRPLGGLSKRPKRLGNGGHRLTDRRGSTGQRSTSFGTGPGVGTGIGCCSRRLRISPSSAARSNWLTNC